MAFAARIGPPPQGDPKADIKPTETPDGPYDSTALTGPTLKSRNKDITNGLWL